jgi:hypothetical protein
MQSGRGLGERDIGERVMDSLASGVSVKAGLGVRLRDRERRIGALIKEWTTVKQVLWP